MIGVDMDRALASFIRSRARDRCEYCQLLQSAQPLHRFHIDHIVPQQHGGETLESNLAPSCPHCNFHKSPNLSGIDPETQQFSPLFNPRMQNWSDHFKGLGVYILGITPIGRATVRVLAMNDALWLELRSLLEG